jgi:hypothetical protein
MIGDKVKTNVGSATEPKGSKQSSGKTIHNRKGGVNLAGKGENLNGMPTVHG